MEKNAEHQQELQETPARNRTTMDYPGPLVMTHGWAREFFPELQLALDLLNFVRPTTSFFLRPRAVHYVQTGGSARSCTSL